VRERNTKTTSNTEGRRERGKDRGHTNKKTKFSELLLNNLLKIIKKKLHIAFD
jgi:hypothetical protein